MIYILLPAYNEEENIAQVLSGLSEVLADPHQQYQVVVVNDGSADNTKAIVEQLSRQLPVELLNFDKNQGVGAVFNLGINYIVQKAKNEDLLISMDCDQTHPAGALPQMISRLKSDSDIVIASRYHEQSRAKGLPFIRRLLSDTVNSFLKLSFPCKNVRDYTTFYRGYRIELLKKALDLYGNNFIEQAGFACMAEILIKLRKFKPRMSETPLTLRFDLRTGKSKMKFFSTIFGYFKLVFAQKISSLFSQAEGT